MAREEGLELSPNQKWQVENLKAQILAKKYLEQKMPNEFSVSDLEIKEFYDENQDQFKRENDEVHLVHLYFDQLDNALVREIRQSKSLVKVIEDNKYLDRQIDRVVEPNGDLGYVAENDLSPEFKRAIRGSSIGRIYGPIKTDEGFHYLQVLDRKPGGSIRELELVKDEIATLLRIKKRQEREKIIKQDIRKKLAAETFYNNIL